MVRWAQESVIEDPDLVRAMFVLLHRQYDGIGGQVGLVYTVTLKNDRHLKGEKASSYVFNLLSSIFYILNPVRVTYCSFKKQKKV